MEILSQSHSTCDTIYRSTVLKLVSDQKIPKAPFQSQLLVEDFLTRLASFIGWLCLCLIADNLAMGKAESVSKDVAVGFLR